ARQAVRQKKRVPRYNSFVASYPRQEFQADLADFGAGLLYRYGLFVIDIFSKKLAVVALPDKTSETTAQGLDIALKRLGQPVEFMTDEGGEFLGDFARRLEYYDIH